MTIRSTAVALAALLTVAVTVAAQNAPPPKPPANIAGKWIMTLQMEMGAATPALEFKQDGEKLTGTYTGRYGAFPFTGTIKERALQFAFKMSAEGMDVDVAFSGEVAADGQTMKGRGELGGIGEVNWTAKRAGGVRE